MAVRGTIFGVAVKDDGSQYIETYSVYRGVTELVVFDKVNGQIIKGKLEDISNSKIEIKRSYKSVETEKENASRAQKTVVL